MVDAAVSNTVAERRVGSNPTRGTKQFDNRKQMVIHALAFARICGFESHLPTLVGSGGIGIRTSFPERESPSQTLVVN